MVTTGVLEWMPAISVRYQHRYTLTALGVIGDNDNELSIICSQLARAQQRAMFSFSIPRSEIQS